MTSYLTSHFVKKVPDRKHENEKYPTQTRPFQVRLLIPIGASGRLGLRL